jgi:hypothetical protein
MFNERIQFLRITQNVIHLADKITAPPADVGTIVQLTRDQTTKMRERDVLDVRTLVS